MRTEVDAWRERGVVGGGGGVEFIAEAVPIACFVLLPLLPPLLPLPLLPSLPASNPVVITADAEVGEGAGTGGAGTGGTGTGGAGATHSTMAAVCESPHDTLNTEKIPCTGRTSFLDAGTEAREEEEELPAAAAAAVEEDIGAEGTLISHKLDTSVGVHRFSRLPTPNPPECKPGENIR